MTINPMQSAHDAPRCKAKSKRTGSAVERLRYAALASVEVLKTLRAFFVANWIKGSSFADLGRPGPTPALLPIAEIVRSF